MRTKIIGIFLFGMAAWSMQSCSSGNAGEEDKELELHPLVKLSKVERTRFTHDIRVQGNIETDMDVTLTAEMGGLITNILVKEGQTVHQGQVIARVDASVLSSNLQELQTQLEYAQYMLEKQQELNKRGVGSEFDLETAKNRVKSLQASMNSLNTQRGKAVIKAPFTGVIDRVFAHDGQMAGPASPIVRLVNNKSVDVVATISEKHFAKIKVGTPIQVTFPNYTDTVIELGITNVGNYIEPTNRTFRIMSSVKNNSFLLPNMLAEVRITDMDVPNGLVIPSESVLKDQESNDFVYVAVPTKATPAKKGEKQKAAAGKGQELFEIQKKIVKVIERSEGLTLIDPSSQVKEGDNVIVEGARGVTSGEIVQGALKK